MKRILTLYFFASRTNSNVRVVPLAFAHRDEQIAYVNQKCSKGSKNSIFGSTCSNRILTLYIYLPLVRIRMREFVLCSPQPEANDLPLRMRIKNVRVFNVGKYVYADVYR